jgi:hypothetical protein
MIHYSIHFEKYDWCVEVFIVLTNPNIKSILDSLYNLECPK